VLTILKTGLLGPAGLIFLGVLISAVGAFWAALQQIGFERELMSRSGKIAELNQDALHGVTGSDSFRYIQFVDTSADEAKIQVIHSDTHPIYDVEDRIVDLVKVTISQT
jgi:hypothetical protein